MSEKNANPSPSGYHEIPRRAINTPLDAAIAITAMILILAVGLLAFGILFVASWPWGVLVALGVLNLFGLVYFIVLHREKR